MKIIEKVAIVLATFGLLSIYFAVIGYTWYNGLPGGTLPYVPVFVFVISAPIIMNCVIIIAVFHLARASGWLQAFVLPLFNAAVIHMMGIVLLSLLCDERPPSKQASICILALLTQMSTSFILMNALILSVESSWTLWPLVELRKSIKQF